MAISKAGPVMRR